MAATWELYDKLMALANDKGATVHERALAKEKAEALKTKLGDRPPSYTGDERRYRVPPGWSADFFNMAWEQVREANRRMYEQQNRARTGRFWRQFNTDKEFVRLKSDVLYFTIFETDIYSQLDLLDIKRAISELVKDLTDSSLSEVMIRMSVVIPAWRISAVLTGKKVQGHPDFNTLSSKELGRKLLEYLRQP